MSEYPDAFSKRPHRTGCDGGLFNTGVVHHTDRTGRLGNGSLVTHEYVCNMRWAGCAALVLVTEKACRNLAVAVEQRRSMETMSGPQAVENP